MVVWLALVVLIVVAGVVIANTGFLRQAWTKRQARLRNAELTQEIMRVWAALGPFKSAAESAQAMYRAHTAVGGPEVAATFNIAKHIEAFESDPGRFDTFRSGLVPNVKTQHYLTIARGLAGIAGLNKDLEEVGYRLEYGRRSDGSLGIISKQTLSDGEIEAKSKARWDSIFSGMHARLADDPGAEAQALLTFLRGVYTQHSGCEPTPIDVGRTWMTFIKLEEEPTDSAIVNEYKRLSAAFDEISKGSESWPRFSNSFRGRDKWSPAV